jgi:hypothetical protein
MRKPPPRSACYASLAFVRPDGVLRLDSRTGQVSQCSRSDAGWACNRLGRCDRENRKRQRKGKGG